MDAVQVAAAVAGLWGLTVFGFVAALFQLGAKTDAGFRAMDARFDAVNGRIDDTNARMHEGFRALNAKMDDGFTALNARMDDGFRAQNARSDGLAGLLQAHIERHAG